MESNERYYRRRAVEERMAAQRAVTEVARAWHAKLAEDYAAFDPSGTWPDVSRLRHISYSYTEKLKQFWRR